MHSVSKGQHKPGPSSSVSASVENEAKKPADTSEQKTEAKSPEKKADQSQKVIASKLLAYLAKRVVNSEDLQERFKKDIDNGLSTLWLFSKQSTSQDQSQLPYNETWFEKTVDAICNWNTGNDLEAAVCADIEDFIFLVDLFQHHNQSIGSLREANEVVKDIWHSAQVQNTKGKMLGQRETIYQKLALDVQNNIENSGVAGFTVDALIKEALTGKIGVDGLVFMRVSIGDKTEAKRTGALLKQYNDYYCYNPNASGSEVKISAGDSTAITSKISEVFGAEEQKLQLFVWGTTALPVPLADENR